MVFKFAFEKNLSDIPKLIVKSGNKFDGLIVFGDLIENAVSDRKVEVLKDFYEVFGFVDIDEWTDYYEAVCCLRTIIEQGKLSTSKDVDSLRPHFSLTFKQIFVEKNKNGSISPALMGHKKEEPPYLLETEKEHCCIYECVSMRDGVFSLLHYLFLNGYKLKKCEHCGKYFPTKTLKRKYCSRNSPYRKHKDKSCGEAVDHIMKTIKKRRKNILKYMRKYFPKAIPEFTNELDAALKTPKNVAQLDELEHLTSKEYVKEHWYKEKYK